MNLTEKQHWELIAALYKHGTDIKALHSALPQWGPETLQIYVTRLRFNVLRKEKSSDKTGEAKLLAGWLAHTENMQVLQGTLSRQTKKGRLAKDFCPDDHGPLLSKVMLYLSEEEEHPPPSSPLQPDYEEIYRYLSQVLAGQEPSQVSQGSARKLIEMLERVSQVANKSRYKGLLNHLHRSTAWTNELEKGTLERESYEAYDARRNCPLFQETADTEEQIEEEVNLEDFNKNNPQFQRKKQKVLKKCLDKQMAVASSLSDVNGLNPYNLAPQLLRKPEGVTMEEILK